MRQEQNRKEDKAPDRGPAMPTNGGGFQDDIYLWSHDKEFLQAKLHVMVRSLGARNLQVNATKTKYVHTLEGRQVVKVGEKEVVGEKGGTVVALAGEVVQVIAEVARRARGAFATHKKLLTGAGSVDRKLLEYTRYVSTSALWAIGAAHPHDALLKGINSIQLMQLRQVLNIKRKPLEQWTHESNIPEASKSLPGEETRASLVHHGIDTSLEIVGTHSQTRAAYWVDAGMAESGMVAGGTGKAERPSTPLPVQCHVRGGKDGGKNCQAMERGGSEPHKVEANGRDFRSTVGPAPWSSGKQPSLENLAPN